MISYDSYQNKIKRVAAVKNFIVRFRALFIILFAAIIALISAFIFTKGIITKDIVLPEKIVYGDSYSNEIQAPKALFGKARYQFKRVEEGATAKASARLAAASEEIEKESEWTYEAPSLAGRYLVRTVSDKTFGKSYGAPKEFEIKPCPAEFKIESESIVYGEMPESYTFVLKSGDRLVTEGVKFVYDTDLSVSNICANASSFVILNGEGKDVTFCYNISVSVNPEEVTVVPKDITLTPEPFTAVYSGRSAEYVGALDRASEESLSGDVARFDTKIYDSDNNELAGIPVDAGVYTVEIVAESTAVYNGDVNVTAYYNITYSTSTLEIRRRPVTVTTASDGKEYDGTPLVNGDCVADGIVEGHSIRSAYNGEAALGAGRYKNIYECAFLDGGGADVTENYVVTYEYGTLEVFRRSIAVTTSDRSKVYDGSALSESDFGKAYLLSKEGYDYGGVLVAGHTHEIIHSNSILLASQSETLNEILIGIFDSDGNDVSENYRISYEYGTLEILRREITVTSADASFVYDGGEHSAPEIVGVVWSDGSVGGSPVVDGERIVVISGSSVTYYTGEAVSNTIECAVLGSDGEKTANYQITYICGSLKIEKRRLTVTTPTISWQYDGYPHYGDEEETLFDGLVDGEVPELYDLAVITYCGENTANNNTTTFKFFTDESRSVETTDCYETEYVYGTLSIDRAPLVITTSTLSWVYDGKAHLGSGVQETENGKPVFYGLADGEYSEAFNIAEIKNYAENAAENNTTEYRFYTDSTKSKETTENYVISYIYGTIAIEQRRILVKTDSDEKEYDGTPLTCKSGNVFIPEVNGNPASYALVEGHSIEIVNAIGTITDVKYKDNGEIGSEENYISYKVVDSDGNDGVNGNYVINYEYGTLKITPRNIRLTTANGEWVYSGEAYSNPAVTEYVHGSIAEDNSFIPDDKFVFVDGHSYVLREEFFAEDAGEHNNNCMYYVVDEVISRNYDIVINPGTLKINPRPIIITTADDDKVYDGTPLINTNATDGGGEYKGEKLPFGLVGGHTLKAISETSITDVERNEETDEVIGAENKVTYDIYYGDKKVSDNYTVTYEYGTLTIYPRPIIITTADDKKVYDGIPLINTNAEDEGGEYKGEKLPFGLVDGHSLFPLKSTAVTDVNYDGETHAVIGVENIVIYEISDGENSVNGNYDIVKYNYGTLTVNPRPIIITTADDKKVYDGTPLINTNAEDEGGIYDGEKLPFGLVEGHTLKAISETSITDVERNEETDEVIGAENKVTYDIYYGDKKVSGNYDIVEYKYGTLIIYPRPIIITTADDKKVYDGTPLFNITATDEGGFYDGEKLSFGLVRGHSLSVVTKTEITDVERNETGEVIGVKNIVTYDIYDGETKVSGNYEISYEYGTLTINPRPIQIVTEPAAKIYDGAALTCDKFIPELSKDGYNRGLLEKLNHSVVDITVDIPSITYINNANIGSNSGGQIFGQVINARSYKITCGDDDVTKNYVINYYYGSLVIWQKALTVTTATLSQVYNGEYLYGEEEDMAKYKAEFDGLLSGEIAEAFNIASVKKYSDNAENNNTTEYKFYTADLQVETTLCYNIEYVRGTLTIERIELNITTITAFKVYDGTLIFGDIEQDTENGKLRFSVGGVEYGSIGEIVSGEDCKSVTSTVVSFTDFSVRYNTTAYTVYNVDTGETTDENYIITYTKGTLSIEKRVIEIQTQSKELEYDGSRQKWTDYDYAGETPLVDGHILQPVTYTDDYDDVLYGTDGITVIGVENAVTYKVVDGNGSDEVNKNYEIKVVGYGTLTIVPRKILITTASGEWEYDGAAHSAPDFKEAVHVATGSKTDALVLTHRLIPDGEAPAVTHVNDGTIANDITFKVVLSEADATSVSGNYEISYSTGEIKITARRLTIGFDVKDSVYGDLEYTSDVGYIYADGSKRTVDGETLEITVKYQLGGADTVPKNAGSYIAVADVTEIIGGELSDYEITVKDGGTAFSITPRPVTLSLLKQEGRPYNGDAFVFPKDGYVLEGGSLAYDDMLSVAVRYAGNRIPLDAGEYTVIFNSADSEINGDKNLTKNYNITCSNDGGLVISITKIKISFDLNGLTAVYSGEEYVFVTDKAVAKANTPVKDDYLASARFITSLNGAEVTARNANADGESYDYTVGGFTILHADGSVSDNYELSEEQASASLTIEKRAIDVSVWFKEANGESNAVSREYKNEAYDLFEMFRDRQPYGPFKSNLTNSTEYGIYEGDLAQLNVALRYTDKNGESVDLPEDYGSYTVSLLLWGSVMQNYAVEAEKSYAGYFAITERQIIVSAVVSGKLEYDGTVLDKDRLSFDSRHVFSEEKGFKPDTDAESYTAEYSLYDLYDTAFANNLIDGILQAGTYILRVRLTLNGGAAEKYLIAYEDVTVTVARREIYVQVADYPDGYIYNGEAVKHQTEYVTYYADGNWVENSGFIGSDAVGIAAVTYSYYNLTTLKSSSAATDAGEYIVSIVGFETVSGCLDISKNYKISDLGSAGASAPERGRLSIKPATIIVVPKAYSEAFDGSKLTLSLPESSFEILYVEGRSEGDCTLFGDDSLSVTADGVVDITNVNVKRVGIGKVNFSNTEPSNYDVIYGYDAENELLAKLNIKSNKFNANLKFLRTTITVKQLQVPDEYKIVQVGDDVDYNDFLAKLGEYTLGIVDGSFGSNEYAGSVIKIKDISFTTTSPKTVTKWMRTFTVYDANGNDVSMGYKINVDTSDASTYIEVVKREITVSVNCSSSLTDFVDGETEFSVLEGGLLYDDRLELHVVEGRLVATVFRNKSDKTDCYSVKFVFNDTQINLKEAEYASRL